MTNEQLAALLGHIAFRVRHAGSFLDATADVQSARAALRLLASDLHQQEGRLLGEFRQDFPEDDGSK